MNPSLETASSDFAPAPEIPEYYTKVVRRHAHDIRNHLNGLELDATLIEEFAPDPSLEPMVAQMRRHLTQLEATVKALVAKFTPPRPMAVNSGDVMQLWRMQVSRLTGPEQPIEWVESLENDSLDADLKALIPVMCDLTLAAARRAHGKPLKASLHPGSDSVVAELREPPLQGQPPYDLLALEAPFVRLHGCRLEMVEDQVTHEWLTLVTFPRQGSLPAAGY